MLSKDCIAVNADPMDILKFYLKILVLTMSKILRRSKSLWKVFCSPCVLSTMKERMFPTNPTLATVSSMTPSTRKVMKANQELLKK